MKDLTRSSRRIFAGQFDRRALVSLGLTPESHARDGEERFDFPLQIPASPLQLWRHLSLKLILNTVSTATQCRLDRVWGNAMTWVSPSNKKLVDRGCRLIAQSTGCSYEQACVQLFRSLEQVEARRRTGQQVSSPVALAIEAVNQDKRSSR
jgi:N-acetylmuramic acid 6-phosphate etherase